MREPFAGLFPRLQREVRNLLDRGPQCHGWDHTLRVWHNARRLGEVEGADMAVVAYAAMLHDIGRAEELADRGKTCHAEAGAARVPGLLYEVGVESPAFVRHVADCVATHRYRRRNERVPASLEARIVFDADKLDSMGAVGVGRAFHFAGRVGARVHNTREEALGAPSYSVEDSAYREYLVKLQHLREVMLTEEGRRIARERHAFMEAFFDRLDREVRGRDGGASTCEAETRPGDRT